MVSSRWLYAAELTLACFSVNAICCYYRNDLSPALASLPQKYQPSSGTSGGLGLISSARSMHLWQPESTDELCFVPSSLFEQPLVKLSGTGFSQQLCDEYHLSGLPALV